MYMLAKLNTFSRSWKTILRFNTFQYFQYRVGTLIVLMIFCLTSGQVVVCNIPSASAMDRKKSRLDNKMW